MTARRERLNTFLSFANDDANDDVLGEMNDI